MNNSDNVCSERAFIFHERPKERRKIITAQLRDSSSGDVVELSNWQSWESFEHALKAYSPYGYVQGTRPDCSDVDAALFVQADSMSVQFLSHIKSIVPADVSDFDVRQHVSLLQQSLTLWGSDGDIVEWISGQYICPLFQMVCFAPSNWYDDKFYMRTGNYHTSMGYCVEFNDVSKTRAFIAKAACMGYNPVAEHIRSGLY